VALAVRMVLLGVPIAGDLSLWWASAGNWMLALLVGLTAFAFHASRAGQPLFGAVLDD
jgi:hypothetical protein